jgi:hypothetical protein
MSNNLTKFLESSDNEIITDSFVIKDNVLKFEDVTLQLSNISRIYAGKKTLKIPVPAIIVFIVSLLLVFVQPLIGIIGCLLSGWYIFSIYQAYLSGRIYLSFLLNSGSHYSIFFKENEFLEEVRAKVEMAFNKQNVDYTVNVAEQKIIQGDHHEFKGDHNNLNWGIQKDTSVNSHNADSFNHTDDHSSVKIGDIQNSSIHSSTIGSKNNVSQDSEGSYDWKTIELALKAVISSIKINSSVKSASQEALEAAEKKNKTSFESIIKKNKKEFLSDLFQNTASGILVQVIAAILGIV